MRFCKKGKLCPHDIGSYKTLRSIGEVVNKHELPNELSMMHHVFHVSLLKKCNRYVTSTI